MRNIKLTIQYDGSRYLGWQRLSASDLTIQGKLEDVITKMIGEETTLAGSGRTDAGVHSRGQTANFKTSSAMPLKEMQAYMNHYLPKDIVVSKMSDVDERFHSRYNVKSKKYAYYIWTGEFQPPFVRKYSWHYPDHIDSVKMVEASKKLLGTHDFVGFSSLKKSKKSTIRTLDSIEIRNEGMMLVLEFSGDGFLHNMVRILAGTLIDIGTGRIQPEKIDEIFETGIRADAGITAPPHGLFLEQVRY